VPRFVPTEMASRRSFQSGRVFLNNTPGETLPGINEKSACYYHKRLLWGEWRLPLPQRNNCDMDGSQTAVGDLECMAGIDYIREMYVSKAYGGTKLTKAPPPASCQGRWVLRTIILLKRVDIFFILYNVRPELFFEGCVMCGMACNAVNIVKLTLRSSAGHKSS